MKNKTIILHDTFLYKWGWERLILMMGKALEADIATWFFSKGSFDLRKEGFTWKMISVSSEIFAKWLRHIKLKWAFLFKTKFLSDYETVIFSWDCISAVRNCRRNTKKVYYCHTPPAISKILSFWGSFSQYITTSLFSGNLLKAFTILSTLFASDNLAKLR